MILPQDGTKLKWNPLTSSEEELIDIFQYHSTAGYNSELEISSVDVVNAEYILLDFDVRLEVSILNLSQNAVEPEAPQLSYIQLVKR